MRKCLHVWRRELASMFLSPVAYTTLAVFFAVCGGFFIVESLRSEGAYETLAAQLFEVLYAWLLILVTVACMRLFAEEKKSGTLESLMAAPISDCEVVAGKFFGALSFVLLASLPAVSYIYVLSALSPAMDYVDHGAVIGGCFGLVLFSIFFVSLGTLVSLMTDSQMTAALVMFSCMIAFVVAGWTISAGYIGLEEWARYISCIIHAEEFSRGILDTRPMALYISGCVFFLFTAVRTLESRRWL